MMRLILHIGQHKTGSKALQYFLSLNAQVLQRHHVNYATSFSDTSAPAYQHSHHHWFQALFTYTEEKTSERLAQFETIVITHIQAAKDQGSEICIISSEDLWLMQTAHELDWQMHRIQTAVSVIRSLCDRFNLKLEVVLYLRDQSGFLKASYAQYIKGESRGTMNFDTFRRRFQDRLDHEAIINTWKNQLPDGALHIRPYQSQASWDIRQDFLEHVLERPSTDMQFTWPQDTVLSSEARNRTPHTFKIYWLRLRNIIKKYRY
jgi:hypothetical protein